MEPCQQSAHCVLWWGSSRGGLPRVRKLPFPYTGKGLHFPNGSPPFCTSQMVQNQGKGEEHRTAGHTNAACNCPLPPHCTSQHPSPHTPLFLPLPTLFSPPPTPHSTAPAKSELTLPWPMHMIVSHCAGSLIVLTSSTSFLPASSHQYSLRRGEGPLATLHRSKRGCPRSGVALCACTQQGRCTPFLSIFSPSRGGPSSLLGLCSSGSLTVGCGDLLAADLQHCCVHTEYHAQLFRFWSRLVEMNWNGEMLPFCTRSHCQKILKL